MSLGAFVVLVALGSDADAGTPVELTVGGAPTVGDLDIAGTYAEVSATVGGLVTDQSARIAIPVPGLDEVGPFPTVVTTHDATQTVVFDAVPLSAGQVLAAGATSAAVVLDWDDAVDTEPTAALILRDASGATLSALEPAWPTDDDPGLVTADLVLASSAASLDATGVPGRVAELLRLDDDDVFELTAGATLSAAYERGTSPVIDAVLADVDASTTAEVPVVGPLTDDVASLLAGAPVGDPDTFAVTATAPGLPTPSWMDARSVTVLHALDDSTTPATAVRTRSDSVTIESTTFSGSDVLGDGGPTQIALTTSSFTPPFGLDGLLGGLTLDDVELRLTTDAGTVTGELAFTLPIGDGVRTEIALETDGDRIAGTLALDEGVGLGELLEWLGTRPGFTDLDTGVPVAELDRVHLAQGELTFATDGDGTTFTAFASASVALAGDPIGFDVLVSVHVPTGADPQALVALRSADDTRLGDVLPVPDGPAADLLLPRFTLLVALPDTFAASPSDLGGRAEAFLADVLGDPLDDPLAIGPSVLLRAEVAVDSFGADVAGALGWDPAGTVVLEGEVGIDLGALIAPDPADPSAPPAADPITSLRLAATIPNGGAPTWAPDFLAWPDGGSWGVEIGYDVAADELTLSAGLAGATVTLPGDTSAVPLDLSATFTSTTDGIEVALSGAIGTWAQPYGVEWLTIDGAALDVTVAKQAGQPVEVEIGFAGGVTIGTTSLEVEVELASGGDGTQARIRIALLDTVTVAQVADLLGADLGAYEQLVGSLGFGPGELVVTAGDGWSVEAVVGLEWDPYDDGLDRPIAVKLLFDVRKPGAVGGVAQPLRVAVGIQPDERLTLASFLPATVDVPVDIALAEPDDPTTPEDERYTIGLVYTSATFDPSDLDERSPTRAWFEPLFIEGESTRVSQGVGVYGAIPLPDAVSPLLRQLGVVDEVQLKGRLPLGSAAAATGLEMSLGLRLDPDALPTVVHGAGLSIEVAVNTTGEASLTLIGDLTLAIERGLRGDAATALADIGVEPIVPIAPDGPCDGGVVKPVDGQYFCHDLLTAEVSAKVSVGVSGVGFTIGGNLYSGAPGEFGDGWRPFGIDWLVFRQMQISLGLEAGPTGASIDVGIGANIDVAGKNLSGALSLGFAPLANPPYLLVEFNGLRAAAPNGLSFGDVVSLANTIGGGTASLTDAGLPDIGLRNLAFSVSPLGVPELCIAQGLRIQADLYIQPPGVVAADPDPTPICDPNGGEPVRPGPSASCAERRDEGCFAGILLDLSTSGIVGQGSVAAFDIGPIEWSGGQVDLELTLDDQSLLVEGAGKISVGNAVLVQGELFLSFDRTQLTYYGAMQTVNGALNVLVDGDAGIDVFNQADPAGLRLHVLVATSSAKIGDPSIGQSLVDALTADLERLNSLVDGIDAILLEWDRAGGNATGLFTDLPVILGRLGVDVPTWVRDVSSAIATIDRLDVFGVVDDLVDAALNGVKIGELTIPGLCQPVFPDAAVAGRCTLPRIARAYITPVVRTAITATVSGLESIDGTQLDSALKAAFDGAGKVIRLDCAEFLVDLGVNASNRIAMTVNGAVFGEPVGFLLDITPDDFTGLSGRVDQMLVDVFENLGSGQPLPGCTGYRADLFGVGEADPEAPVVPVLTVPTASESVAEGGTATVTVQYQGGVSGERPLDVAWGDGTVDRVMVGAAPLTLTHVYGDDDPAGTSADAYEVVARDPATGRTSTDSITVTNVVPTIEASFVAAVDEGAPVEIDVVVTDPGADRHTLVFTWGDGTTEQVELPAGVKAGASTRFTHVYADDDPSATPFDVVGASVTVLDDDLGFATAAATVEIRDVAPTVDAGPDHELDELGTVTLDVSFTDPGLLDTHSYVVDWGDGNVSPLIAVSAGGPTDRRFTTSHQYGDDGTFTITVTVTDDDTLAGSDTVTATVGNVAPTATIAEPVDGATWILADGIDADATIDVPTMLATQGVPSSITARSTDPGSDDLTFTWTWGDGTSTTDPHPADPSRVDPDPSTEVIPRDVTDTPSHVWASPCRYRVDLEVTDDDGGRAEDGTWVVVTGTPTRQVGAGSWAASLQGTGSVKLSPTEVACYLQAVDHLSAVFGSTPDGRSIVTAADAVAILNPGGGKESTTAQLDRALLVGWLELLHGGVRWTEMVDTDGDRMADATFGELLRSVEALRADASATRADLQQAQQLLAGAIRR